MKWFLSLISITQALPVSQKLNSFGYQYLENSSDITTVCIYNELVYPRGANFTTDNPCETCICDPPEYRCTVKTCNLKYGCKTIQKADRCCPEYVCDCEINGKLYANGEKILAKDFMETEFMRTEEPNPCKVCYCKGGEIKCTSIICYSRDDCEPVYVEGECCPKYDDCPPLEMMKNLSVPAQPTPVIVFDLVPPDFKIKADKNIPGFFEWAITNNGSESEVLLFTDGIETTTKSTSLNTQEASNGFDEHFIFENGFNETESWKRVTNGIPETSEESDVDNSSKTIDFDSVEKWNELNITLNGSDSRVFEVIYGSDNETERSEVKGNETHELKYVDDSTISEENSESNDNENVLLNDENLNENETLQFEAEVVTEESIEFENTTVASRGVTILEFPDNQDLIKKLQEVKDVKSVTEFQLVNDTISGVNNEEDIEMKANENITVLPNEKETPTVQITRMSNPSSGIIEEIAPGLKMINEHIQYLQVGEASTLYADSVQSIGNSEPETEPGIVVVPETTPTIIEMMEVVDVKNSTVTN